MTTAARLSEWTGSYALDAARTRIGFVARHTIGPGVRGEFEKFEGSARLDGDDPARSSVTLTIEAGSLTTRNARRDDQLRGKFLRQDAHPVMTFTSTGVRQIDESDFELTGDLTIRGVTRPVTVALEWTGAEQDPLGDVRLRFTGTAVINRRDWGVSYVAAAGLVAAKVALEFDVTAIRQD